jgi:hypothetical protein
MSYREPASLRAAVERVSRLLDERCLDELAAEAGVPVDQIFQSAGGPELFGRWWPFPPGSRYLRHADLRDAAIVEVVLEIDQGDGTTMIRPGRVWFTGGPAWRVLPILDAEGEAAAVRARVDAAFEPMLDSPHHEGRGGPTPATAGVAFVRELASLPADLRAVAVEAVRAVPSQPWVTSAPSPMATIDVGWMAEVVLAGLSPE